MPAEGVSPGRLYYLLSEEFRRLRLPGCTSCRPPLIEPAAEGDAMPNWVVPRSMSLCEPCNAALDRAARKLGPLYRLVDLAGTRTTAGAHEPYDIHARVDFVAPGQFVVKARALSPNGNEMFSASAG